MTYYANNVSATVSLLQTMAEFDCRRIVYSSSATVYGTPPVIPIPETTRLQADSPYGRTKIMAETIISDLCSGMALLPLTRVAHCLWMTSGPDVESDFSSLFQVRGTSPFFDEGISLMLVGFISPAGAHPSGRIGEDPRGRPGNLLPLLAHMAVGRVKDSTLKVFGNDYPTPCAFPPSLLTFYLKLDYLAMERVFGITFILWTSLRDMFFLSTHSVRIRPSSPWVRHLPTRLITSERAKASACFRLWKLCARRRVSITNTRLSDAGKGLSLLKTGWKDGCVFSDDFV